MAERVGFEPTVGIAPNAGFQDRCIQPLCHLSVPIGAAGRADSSSPQALFRPPRLRVASAARRQIRCIGHRSHTCLMGALGSLLQLFWWMHWTVCDRGIRCVTGRRRIPSVCWPPSKLAWGEPEKVTYGSPSDRCRRSRRVSWLHGGRVLARGQPRSAARHAQGRSHYRELDSAACSASRSRFAANPCSSC